MRPWVQFSQRIGEREAKQMSKRMDVVSFPKTKKSKGQAGKRGGTEKK
jgi:hypothetical protein